MRDHRAQTCSVERQSTIPAHLCGNLLNTIHKKTNLSKSFTPAHWNRFISRSGDFGLELCTVSESRSRAWQPTAQTTVIHWRVHRANETRVRILCCRARACFHGCTADAIGRGSPERPRRCACPLLLLLRSELPGMPGDSQPGLGTPSGCLRRARGRRRARHVRPGHL